MSTTMSHSFVKIGSKTKKNINRTFFCKQTANTSIQFSQKPRLGI